jgi:hypothetical protein
MIEDAMNTPSFVETTRKLLKGKQCGDPCDKPGPCYSPSERATRA